MSIGLFATLGMAARALQTQQAGIEVTGHNIANVDNTAYARQRLNIATSNPVATALGMQGTGVQAISIQQIRSLLLDDQIQSETSTSGYWTTQQQALQFAQAAVGEQISSTTTSTDGGTGQGIAQSLSDLFSEFQSLSTQPTSLAERQVLLMKAATLATQFNQAAQRLDALQASLDRSLQTDATNANQLLKDIATLNNQIITAEINSGSTANDLRDLRQQRIEELAKLVNVDVAPRSDGGVNIAIGGVLMVSDQSVLDTLEVYDAGGGQMLVRAATAGTALTITGGSIAGAIDVRDGAVADLSNGLDALAAELMADVNNVHATGFNLGGTKGETFFTGSDARTMAVNTALLNDPSLIQASGVSGEPGNNEVALQLAQLATAAHAALNNQTFSQAFNQTVAAVGQSLATANGQITTQQTVQQMLQQQRASISGVSLDEEMTNLSTYQRAYQASARLMTIIDEMLQTLVSIR
jgi:flagellar hook-associated protein 1 FlgK